ncbi:MAG: hypothetical protein JWQ88_3752 [Rhodoferax sp.]|nr:hypothetical protein [Rhodoferax sp.]
MTPFPTATPARPTFSRLAIAAAVSSALLVAACGGGGGGSPNAPSGPVVGTQETRAIELLDGKKWAFVQDDSLTDAAALAQDGSGWTTVSLPHTWNEKDAASTAQTTPTSVAYKRGIGWYRLEFDGTPPANGTQWLQFDGASIVADVWLNGEKLGQHKGAFTRFRFDVSGKLKAGKNVLYVKADNSKPVAGGPTAIMPLSGDFNMSGGLYRSVSLVSTPAKAHFALDDLGSTGVYATSTSVSANAATVAVRAKLRNSSTRLETFTVRAGLVDANGAVINSSAATVTVKAGEAGEVSQNIAVNTPHLWNGVEDPYLYQLAVQLEDANGTVIDRSVQGYGIREVRFDPEKGFFLNGRSYPLRGVNMHQDFQNKGWAISREDTDKSFAIIKEIGANTVRLAHYPHASYTLEQADKLGFVVWAEHSFVNSAIIPCNAATNPTPEFVDNGLLQLRELVRQQFNHASIATWSIGNEVTQGCTEPGKAAPVLNTLQATAKQEDPSRATTLAANRDDDQVGGITDIWARNEYPMWYAAYLPSFLATRLDALRATFSRQAIGLSEYGAGAALTHYSDNPGDALGFVATFDTTNKSRTVYQPESYASTVHEADYAMIQSRPYLWGTFIWNMFDFGSEVRHEGDIGGTNTKGLVTFDRSVRKDAFYFYKAHWNKEPMTYITDRRYVQRNLPTAHVKVYANTDSTTLVVNGANVKTMTAAECVNRVCDFGDVRLAVGSNNVQVSGSAGGKQASDAVVWTVDADHANNVYLAAGQLTSGFVSETAGPLGQAKAFGSDNYFTGGVRAKLGATQVIANTGAAVPAEGRVWDAYREEATAGAGFAYNLNLVPGKSYLVTLGFVEPTATAAGARVFDVQTTTGGASATPLANVDVFALAGARNAAVTRQFPVTVGADGKLTLNFVGRAGKAMVSNMMVVQQ